MNEIPMKTQILPTKKSSTENPLPQKPIFFSGAFSVMASWRRRNGEMEMLWEEKKHMSPYVYMTVYNLFIWFTMYGCLDAT